MNMHIKDAQGPAMSFLIRQTTVIEPAVYALQYQEIQYPALVPVDYSAPEWIQSVTYFSMDGVGQANWFSGLAQDVPKVELTREKFETSVSMAAIGYGYTLEELGTAQLLGMNLTAEDDGTPVVDHESDDAISDAVRSLGLRGTDHGRHQMFFGGVGAAYRRDDGSLEAAGDPRREAEVGVVSRG